MQPQIIYREHCPDIKAQADSLGLHPVVARVLANRATPAGVAPSVLIGSSLQDLDHPSGLPDIEKAAARIATAVANREVIALATDHDVDGVTSHAVLFTALVSHFGHDPALIQRYIGLRLQEGYGLSVSLCDRIIEAPVQPSLVITADMGSSDGPRIQRLAEQGIDVIVTDHHGIPGEGTPEAAFACISPMRDDSQYPDRCIAGVMVAWLLMCSTRIRMMEQRMIPATSPSLGALLDFVALGTVADCVSLSRSINNRRVIAAGIDLINRQARPCWAAFINQKRDPAAPVTATDLGFGLGPRINATGRLADAMVAVDFLLAPNTGAASGLLVELEQQNEERKAIEKSMQQEALCVGEQMVECGQQSLCLYFQQGHPGVHGIVASRVVEAYGRPTICLSPTPADPTMLSGSCRSIDGLNIREILEDVEREAPGTLVKFGGHEGAAGLTIRFENVEAFTKRFEAHVIQRLNGRQLMPAVWVDSELDPDNISMELAAALDALQPFGREFEPAAFTAEFDISNAKSMGDGTHWRLLLNDRIPAVWFRTGIECPVQPGTSERLVFSVERNWWRGVARLQLQIKCKEP